MQKLLISDKKLRLELKKQEKQCFILKLIFQNSNFLMLVRWNAYVFLKALSEINSKISTSFRCVYTINRKRFNNIAPFSRQILLKLIQLGKIYGLKKSSW